MDVAYLSALSAPAGSVVGGLTTGSTTWISQRSQAQAGRLTADLLRRQDLFKDFILAASKTYAEAVVSSEPKIQEIVAPWAMVSRMRVLCSPATVAGADKIMHLIIDIFFETPKTTAELHDLIKRAIGIDPLQEFSEILDELLKDKDPKTLFSSDGLLGELKKAFAERVLNSEMDHHLSDSRQDEVSAGEQPANHRNGYSKKTVLTENEAIGLSIPRDRQGSFEPQLIAKYQRRFPGFDEKIISMYARGMSVREIQGHLRELYGIEASPQLISTVTDAVLEEVGRWQKPAVGPLLCTGVLRCVAGRCAMRAQCATRRCIWRSA